MFFQWGFKPHTDVSSTVYFPISFKNTEYSICVEIVQRDGARGNTTWDKKPISFVTYQDLICNWIAFGV